MAPSQNKRFCGNSENALVYCSLGAPLNSTLDRVTVVVVVAIQSDLEIVPSPFKMTALTLDRFILVI